MSTIRRFRMSSSRYRVNSPGLPSPTRRCTGGMTSVSRPASCTRAFSRRSSSPDADGMASSTACGAVLGGEALEVGGGALDSQRGDAAMAHGRVVVDQRNGAVRAGADRLHRGDRPVAAVAGAVHDDGHPVEIGCGGDALGADPAEVAMAEHQADRERRGQHEDLSGATLVGDDELDGDQQCAHRPGRDRHRSGLVEAEALEVTSVEPGGVSDAELCGDRHRSQRRRRCSRTGCDRRNSWRWRGPVARSAGRTR